VQLKHFVKYQALVVAILQLTKMEEFGAGAVIPMALLAIIQQYVNRLQFQFLAQLKHFVK